MSDLLLRLCRVLRVLWLRIWSPPPEIAPDNSARLIEIDRKHIEELAEFDKAIAFLRSKRECKWFETRAAAVAAINRASSLASMPESGESYMDRWADGVRVYKDGHMTPIPRK